MGVIIKRMEESLHREKLERPTALEELRKEEQSDPFKILIGTILSARTRDEVTTKVIRNLFKRFKNASDLAQGDIDEIKTLIHSIGFYNIKAKRIKEVSQIIQDNFSGKVPDDIERLIKLPGVGRKTANCILVYGFSKRAIPVDVHVHRISNRLGIVNTNTVEKTEIELSRTTDKKYWLELNNIFVMYGQNICMPIKPKCKICKLKKICKFYQNTVFNKKSSFF